MVSVIYTMNRPDATGDALFAVNDAQGSVRGYAQKGSGLVSAYAYSPYGTLHELKESNATDRSRWQGKEYDGEYGKYYFGSRYFDPLFGIWASPDPAGQFANPYTYGGDPLNFGGSVRKGFNGRHLRLLKRKPKIFFLLGIGDQYCILSSTNNRNHSGILSVSKCN